MEPLNFRSYNRETDVETYKFPSDLPARPSLNTTGKAINIRVNQFKVAQWPQKDVYQFDIHIGTGAEKRGKIMAVWNSNTVQNHIRNLSAGMPWLWDGNKIAWTSFNIAEQRIHVDLDAEKGRPPRADGKNDSVYVIIRPTKTIKMSVIGGYLSKQMAFDSTVLEAINFLDHLMRQGPSQEYTMIKRSFFARGRERVALDNVIEAMKGVYTSIRLCDPKPSIAGANSTGLAINVDVANGTFWSAQDVHQAARNLLGGRNRSGDYLGLSRQLLPIPLNGGPGVTQSDDFKTLRKMVKLKFTVKHRGKEDNKKEYTIAKFLWEKDAKFRKEGVHAKNWTFPKKIKHPDGSMTVKDTSIFDYFNEQYHVNLQHWYLPLIQTTRAGCFPMEVCTLVPNQKYQYKLSPDQTASMIKFAVTRPKERLQAIQHGVNMLKWNQDPYLKHYGMQVEPNMTTTAARLLPPPEVQYAGPGAANVAKPGTSGRWDLRGKKFLFPNPEPLKCWGVVVIGGCVDKPTVQNFLNVFVQTYIGHGGRVENKTPLVYIAPQKEDLETTVVNARRGIGNQFSTYPQIVLFILPGRDSFMYERLKKNMECRFAGISQMMNVNHVKKAQPQYCSNVCMKLNAKLGGTSCKVADTKPVKPFFSRSTMIIGADVSHATPGSVQPSMAAITMSFDKLACRYAAAVQTNGIRVEMISDINIKLMMVPLFKQWITKVGGGRGPEHIYYFRDGVSEGQYAHVLDQEVKGMKAALAEAFGPAAAAIKWTVTICTKRHHIRFFPKENDSAGDKNNNALPGTLVERDITHPFEYDFYLCSHSAIQGTARPVHYHVILDEAQVPPNDFQRMVYQMSYQYMRSTTPVSLFPAVYYAHLASNRARAHESAPAGAGPRGGEKYEEAQQDQAVARAAGRGGSSQTGTSLPPTEARPLLPLGNVATDPSESVKIRCSMWYI